MNTNEIIQCSNLQRTFGKTVALNGIDLTIGRGRIVGLAAPNGRVRHNRRRTTRNLYEVHHGLFTGQTLFSGLDDRAGQY